MMDETEDLNVTNEDDEVKKFRKYVNDAVIQTFCDLDTKILNNKESYTTVLKFIKHCVDVSPSIFVEPSRSNDVALLFSRWLLTKIIQLFSFKNAQFLHDDLLDVLKSLLELIHDRCIRSYNCICNDILCILLKCCSCRSVEITFQPFDDNILLNLDLILQRNSIVISTVEQCWLMNRYLLKTLMCAINLPLFSEAHVRSSWHCLFKLIKFSRLELKSLALEAICLLWVNYNLPKSLSNQLSQIIVAVLKFGAKHRDDDGFIDAIFNVCSKFFGNESCDPKFNLPYLFYEVVKILDLESNHSAKNRSFHLSLMKICFSALSQKSIGSNLQSSSVYDLMCFIFKQPPLCCQCDIFIKVFKNCLSKLKASNSKHYENSVELVSDASTKILYSTADIFADNFHSLQPRLEMLVRIFHCHYDEPHFKSIVDSTITSSTIERIVTMWNSVLELMDLETYESVVRTIILFVKLSLLEFIPSTIISILLHDLRNRTISSEQLTLEAIGYVSLNFKAELKNKIDLSELIRSGAKFDNFKFLSWYLYSGLITSHDFESVLKSMMECNTSLLLPSNISCCFSNQMTIDSNGNLSCLSCDHATTKPSFVNDSVLQMLVQLVLKSNSKVKVGSLGLIISALYHSEEKVELFDLFCGLVEDPDYEVRVAFIEQMCNVLRNHPNINLDGLIGRAEKVYSKAATNHDIKSQETMILTMSNLCKISFQYLTKEVILLLLQSALLSVNPFLKSLSRLEYADMCKSLQISPKIIFHEFKEAICKFLVHAMYNCGDNQEHDLVHQCSNIFHFSDLSSFMSSASKFILPALMSKINQKTSIIIRWISRLQKKRIRDLYLDNLGVIFCFLVCHCSQNESESALLFIQKKSGLQIDSLLRAEYQRVLNELILNLHSHFDQVFSGLVFLASRSEERSKNLKIQSHEQMADFLQPRLLAFLTCFDAQLLSQNFGLGEKKRALSSLRVLIDLMGAKHVTPVRMKIVATLRIALRFTEDDFPNLCCQAWLAFVRNLETLALGPMLNQIIATLLPLAELQPVDVASIFRYMIVENRDEFKEFLSNVYFVPDRQEFDDVRQVLSDHCESLQSDFKSLIEHSIEGMKHESALVRKYALGKLIKVLRDDRDQLYECVVGTDNVDRIISNLVLNLMNGFRDPDTEVRMIFAKCLGELGAIDPGRLQLISNNTREDIAKIHFSVEEDNFAYDLIVELVRAFLAAEDTRIQNCSAFALQEVLQLYECNDSTDRKDQGARLWNRFPQYILEIVTPLLYSKYKNTSIKMETTINRPIFLSENGKTFEKWVINWSIDLLRKIKDPKAKKVFYSCKMIILHDLTTALYLLPRILLYVLFDGTSEDVGAVREEFLHVLTCCLSSESKVKTSVDDSDMSHLTAQVIFSCLDYFTKWRRKRQSVVKVQPSRKVVRVSISSESSKDANLTVVTDFVSSIPKDLLAKVSFKCNGYTRSLMYIEQYLSNMPSDELQRRLKLLQSIYIALDESDGVAGVAAITKTELEVEDQIAVHESIGRFQDALSCYEHAISNDPCHLNSHYDGLIRCLLQLDEPSIALTYVSGIISRNGDLEKKMNKYRIEAAWKLGQWDRLSSFLQDGDRSSVWTVHVGEILLAMRNKDFEKVTDNLKAAKADLIVPLSAASMEKGAYQRAYPYVLKLHMLSEIEMAYNTFFCDQNSLKISQTTANTLFKTWSSRTDSVQSSLRCVEPLLKLRRSLLKLVLHQQEATVFDRGSVETEIGNCWLMSARLARTNSHFQSAYSYLLEASKHGICDVYLEKAELLWSKGDAEQAIITLQKGLDFYYPSLDNSKPPSQDLKLNRNCAKMKLLLTRFYEDSASLDIESIIKMYRKVIELAPDWEDAHFYIGQAYDKVLQTIEVKEQRWNYLACIVKHFGSSLQFECRHVYQSLPRLLTIWFDFGTELFEVEKQLKAQCSSTGKASKGSSSLSREKLAKLKDTERKMKMIMSNMNSLITNLFPNKIPPYVFFTAFPQIISQICHSYPVVFEKLKEIISAIVMRYPNQAMWLMMTVAKSKFPVRSSRCKEVLARIRQLQPTFNKFLQDFDKLADCLIELSNEEPPKNKDVLLSMNRHFKPLIRLVTDAKFSSIMLPIQASMTVTLPNTSGPHPDHNPFVQTGVYISGFEDKIEILSSLQKPKKISIRGNDGKIYDFMCKPKDDLRIDCRLMEFNGLVNKYLYLDPESRKRHLHIRTYCVTPINEECGLIEWVPNLQGLRQILNKIYKEREIHKSSSWIMNHMCPKKAPIEEKVRVFREVFLKAFPPVFSEWFLRNFPDPTAWYLAKVANARTTAVMSMIGYILGLGDRHGENINYDSSCGDVLHVDFNCLFNKGETFEVPEKIPFRLTHNMMEAMGPLGIEGFFRKSCEVTLRVMRTQSETLMSVLKPFIYDPLVEWSKNKLVSSTRQSSTSAIGEESSINRKAKTDVRNCEQRLKGIVKVKVHGIPLSIEGQVDYLIKEATDDKNLASMYIGWGAYY